MCCAGVRQIKVQVYWLAQSVFDFIQIEPAFKLRKSRFSLRYYVRMPVVPYRGNVQGRSPAIGRRDAEGFTHLAPIPKHMPTYEELLSIAMCVNGGSVRRVLNFLSCDHRPTGINSERRSGVRNRKNYGVQKNRKAPRLPRPRRTQTNRIRRQTKQRREIRLASV